MDVISYLLGKKSSGGGSGSAIVDSGSNENGSYIKFQDGTLIQYGRKVQESVTFTQLTSGINYSTLQTITYPIQFVTTDTLPASTVMTRTKNLSWTINVVSAASSITYYVVNSSTSATTVETEWISIGRWK